MRPQRSRAVLAALSTLLIATTYVSAFGQDNQGGRFELSPIDDGFVRLDRQTGEISICRENNGTMDCTPSKDTARAQSEEMDRLRERNSALETEIEILERRLADLENRSGSPPNRSLTLPSEKEVDQALDYFEKLLRNLKGRLNKLEEEFPRRDKPDSDDDEGPRQL